MKDGMRAIGAKSVGRREFLVGMAALGASAGLASCAPKAAGSGDASSSEGESSSAAVALAQAEKTVEADFLVIGGGMAGFCAAVQAAEDGCKNVVLIEKNQTVEGASVSSDANIAGGFEPTNIWINERAERYVDESIGQNFFVANNVLAQQGRSYSIFGSGQVKKLEANGGSCFWSGFSKFMTPMPEVQDSLDEAAADESVSLWKADTIEELAALIEVDADTLKKTVETYNADVAKGKDTAFGKAAELLIPVDQGPFYAAKMLTGILCTMGGIRINGKAQVTTPDGVPIDGLYAAGVCCSGYGGQVYGVSVNGASQGCAVHNGRLAGHAAAERMS